MVSHNVLGLQKKEFSMAMYGKKSGGMKKGAAPKFKPCRGCPNQRNVQGQGVARLRLG